MTALRGDVSIVNCVQPHPSACFIASSGIDAAVKFWSPVGEVSFVALHRLTFSYVLVACRMTAIIV